MPSTNASATNHQSAFFTVSQNTSGSPTRLRSTPTPTSAPDRHEQAAGLDPVEPAQLGRLGAGRRRADVAELVEPVVELVAAAEARRGSSPRAPAAGAPAARRRRSPCPTTRTAAATARSAPTIAAVAARSWATSPAVWRNRALLDAKSKPDDATAAPAPSTSTWLPSSLPWATRAACSVRSSVHTSSSSSSVTASASRSKSSVPGDLLDHEQRERVRACRRPRRAGVSTPASRASSIEVRLVLHLRAPARERGSAVRRGTRRSATRATSSCASASSRPSATIAHRARRRRLGRRRTPRGRRGCSDVQVARRSPSTPSFASASST